MSGKEAAPASSVEIDDGAIPMEENRSWLYAASLSSAAAGAGTRVLAQSLPAAPEASLPALQNAGTAVVSLVAAWELWKRITTNLNACGMQQRFQNQNRNQNRVQKEISRKLELIRITLIFDYFWLISDWSLTNNYLFLTNFV